MNLSREHRKDLERNLSASTLEFLNQEFKKREEDVLKIKELEFKVDTLLNEILQKDKMILQAFSSLQAQGQGQLSSGFIDAYASKPYSSEQSTNPFMNYGSFEMARRGTGGQYTSWWPIYPYRFEEEMRRGGNQGGQQTSTFEARRGVPGSEMEMRRGRRTRSEMEMRRGGGGRDGSSGGGSGTSNEMEAIGFKKYEDWDNEEAFPPDVM